jgi:hypothetical protein
LRQYTLALPGPDDAAALALPAAPKPKRVRAGAGTKRAASATAAAPSAKKMALDASAGAAAGAAAGWRNLKPVEFRFERIPKVKFKRLNLAMINRSQILPRIRLAPLRTGL